MERSRRSAAHILVEKPFAAIVAEADRMIAAVAKTGKQLAINWPLRWYPPHVTAKRLIDEGAIGEVIRSSLLRRQPRARCGTWRTRSRSCPKKRPTRRRRRAGCTSKRAGRRLAARLSRLRHHARHLVHERPMRRSKSPRWSIARRAWKWMSTAITIARYDCRQRPVEIRDALGDVHRSVDAAAAAQVRLRAGRPRRARSAATITRRTIRVQTRQNEGGQDVPVDELRPPFNNPINYVIDCLENGERIDGPLSPKTARIGQRIVDAARLSAKGEENSEID